MTSMTTRGSEAGRDAARRDHDESDDKRDQGLMALGRLRAAGRHLDEWDVAYLQAYAAELAAIADEENARSEES